MRQKWYTRKKEKPRIWFVRSPFPADGQVTACAKWGNQVRIGMSQTTHKRALRILCILWKINRWPDG